MLIFLENALLTLPYDSEILSNLAWVLRIKYYISVREQTLYSTSVESFQQQVILFRLSQHLFCSFFSSSMNYPYYFAEWPLKTCQDSNKYLCILQCRTDLYFCCLSCRKMVILDSYSSFNKLILAEIFHNLCALIMYIIMTINCIKISVCFQFLFTPDFFSHSLYCSY